MTKYIVTGKKPFYGQDCRFYQPGEVVDIVDLHDVTDADGNVKSVGMSPGRFLKPYEPKAKADTKATAAAKAETEADEKADAKAAAKAAAAAAKAPAPAAKPAE